MRFNFNLGYETPAAVDHSRVPQMNCLLLLIILLLCPLALAQSQSEILSSYASTWGAVNFNASCTTPELFDMYFSYYLSFQYKMARDGFQRLLTIDPGCCIAYWGIALTRLTLLWGFPDNSTLAAASNDAASAAACSATSIRMTAREKA
jgi:hypothetical protein